MARILIMTQPASLGHFAPFVGPVQRLTRRGHDVGWICMNDHRAAQVARLGIEVLRTSGDAPLHLLDANWMRDDQAYLEMYRRQWVDSVPTCLALAQPTIAAFRPDLMICDALNFTAHIAAQIGRVPYVGVDTNLFTLGRGRIESRFTRLIPAIFPARDAMFARYGASSEFGFVEAIAPRRNIVFATRALIGGDAVLSPSTRLAGPSLTMAPIDAAPDAVGGRPATDQPTVYFSLGTLFWRHRPQLFGIVAEAVRDLPVQLVISAGDFADSAEARSFPNNVRVFRFVPQVELLKQSSVFLTHGGANSIMEGLSCGVPMLVIPVDFDQPTNGDYVERSGAGLSIGADELTVENCRSALTALMTDGSPQRQAARHIRDDYRAHDGARTTADEVAAVLASPS